AYNIFVNIRLHRLLDVAALERSLNALVERHEALRTTFAMSEGQLLQVIAPDLNIALSCQDLRPLAVSQRETEALRLANEEFQRPFDLTLGPLVRVSVLHLDERDHLLLLTMHHSISDGWSLGLLVQELVALYEAYSTGQPSPLAALPLQFGDFAVWQQEWVQGPMLTEHLAYWKNSLAGAPTMLELPVDRPRLVELARRGAQHTFKLSRELTTALKALSVQEHVTLYMTLVGAFQALLQRYTGQNDLLLGTTSAGRTRTETAQMVGYFTNTLVLRADLAGDPSIRDLLGRVREATLNAQAHQEVPFDILVREFQPDRASGQSPLFQVFLTMDTPLPHLSQDWDVTQLDLETGAAKFDISLDLSERLGSLVGHLEYNADLFNASTIEHMAEHWELLLQAMVHDPAQRLNSIPLLTERERARILFEWNSTRTSYPREQSITRLFTEQVERTPDACAALCEESAQTYRELNARANQLAHYLRRGGFQPGARAGIFIGRSLDMLAGLLGILKAGGVYVPLDPTYPRERLAFMLEDAQVAALVTRQHLAERLPQHTASTICLDRDWPAIALESQENPADFVSGEDSAYMIYTSGSTGRPKGVLGTHRASLNRFNWMWKTYPFTAGEVCCQKTTLSFVDAVWEIFGPLLQGIPLVIIPDPVVKDPARFLQTLARHRVTRIVLVPSLLRALLESGGDLRQQLPALKYWVSSGEALPLELAQRFQQHAPQGSRLINLYGSSEVAADVSYYEIKAGQLLSSVPIGKPIDNTQIYLLDQAMQLVPIGVTGELYIGGDGLARGYFNRPELTLARFVPNPFSREPGARLYRTGDRARYLPDGNLEYLGRFDHQVKLRGMRIELGEIETALSQHPAVSEAAVALREDRPGDQRLIAYVVRQSGEETATSDLQRYLSLHLPGYMVPGVFVLLDALPLTPNGKVNRRVLPTPDYQDSTRETTYVAPQLTIHYQLVQIWEELLTVRPIGIRDDFFALGGHSLLAARLMARIAEVCGKVLPLSLLFKSATIEGLAQALQEESQVQTRTLITPVQASGTQRPFFFLHGDWNGKAFYCLKVSHELGEQRPFYLLEPYRYEGLEALPSLEQVAAAHIEAMRSVQPNGPYLLGGWCNGAMVAYEMAQQLQAAHQEVALLVLMDPGTSSPFSNLLRRVIRGSSYLIKQKQGRPDMLFLRLLHIYEYVRLWNYRKRLAAQANIERPPEEEESAHPNFASLFPPAENLRDNYMAIFNWLASGYQVRPYQGNIAVFWAEEDNRGRRKTWERLLAEQQEMKICFIPGTHMTSRTRHVHVLGEHLRACLDEAE
nr:amino acid adenylation domain-containing protein [Chloroflexota bacterium]